MNRKVLGMQFRGTNKKLKNNYLKGFLDEPKGTFFFCEVIGFFYTQACEGDTRSSIKL